MCKCCCCPLHVGLYRGCTAPRRGWLTFWLLVKSNLWPKRRPGQGSAPTYQFTLPAGPLHPVLTPEKKQAKTLQAPSYLASSTMLHRVALVTNATPHAPPSATSAQGSSSAGGNWSANSKGPCLREGEPRRGTGSWQQQKWR